IFVKLNQFDPNDLEPIRIQTKEQTWRQGIRGLQVMPLHDFEGQHTALVKWPAGERFQPHRHFGGEEILVISGTFKDEHGDYPAGSWLRSPHMSEHNPFVDEETLIMVKVGHLPL
ncbi:MAG: cupin domain-containing protein, partial [Oceanospirillum sp.]|nr:cupin domain-containing protein [Oceanospirillum sp.]